jgi:hypothetical protein
MKYLALILVVALNWNCVSKDLKIDITKFENNISSALKSELDVNLGKIKSKKESNNFNGLIILTKGTSNFQEIDIYDGEIKSIKLFDSKGVQTGFFSKTERGMVLKSNSDSVNTECTWKFFNNLSFLNGTIDEEDHNCVTKIKSDKRDYYVEGNVIKNNEMVISNMIGRYSDTKKIVYKRAILNRKINDTLSTILTFYENLENKYDIKSDYLTSYEEEVKIIKGSEEATISTSFSYKGDLNIYVSLDNYNGKNCSESDALYYSDSYLFENYKYETSNCVDDGLNILNSVLKKDLTVKLLKERFFKKRNNNLYFTKEQSDFNFYY